MRLVALLTIASAVTAVTAIACSSSPPQAANNSQDDTSTTDPAASATPAPAPAPAAAAATTATDGGTVTAISLDAGSTVVPVQIPSAACIAGSIAETEPNNDLTTGNLIPSVTSTFCGHLEPGDIDVVKFVMPQLTAGQQLEFGSGLDFASGPLNMQGFAGGQPFDVQGNWPFLPGQTYAIQVSAASTAPVDYRIPFTFQTL